ncbi:hypothetical protein FRACYDRAFT_236259 [Fragilariopsis cylindrus CCMP1102]|uniref:PNPLA domain-containing protein n=1 Tax=Fragilariopsis cylindrus CCMP1102 TaxID=635003 RepID=A0A1E7FPU0_9STRA|nr:hypothetical protein FRACYDRAFT_236259 [Fragilariopsis cylindrus CCMP1102]|eukprot:OEU20190.1 hypothetical protein FRACYDRAFT_236259 [Fragilariopsis cylindrus CCMP1102]
MMLLPHLLPLVYASNTFTNIDNHNTPTITTATNTATATISTAATTTTTLREFLMQHDDNHDGSSSSSDENENDDAGGVYLAMAPAFFGFYGYFGALGGIEDALFPVVSVPVPAAESIDEENDKDEYGNTISLLIKNNIIKGVSGASSGAMAAVLLAAGISPNVASKFVSTLELKHFDDWFGLGSLMKGDKFESLMHDFILSSSPIIINKNDNSNDSDNSNNTNSITATIPKRQRQLQLHFEEAYIPVAISVTDILPNYGSTATSTGTLSLSFWNPWSYFYASLPKPKIIKEGPMSRAVRASACFPGLFQPVGWIDYYTSSNRYNGLKEIINTKSATIPTATTNSNSNSNSNSNKIRVLNMVMGGFGTHPHGPLEMTNELFSSSESQDSDHSSTTSIDSVLSLSIINLPSCGPFSMSNGPIAINAAKNVIRDIMDRPIQSMPIMMPSSSSSSINENNDNENDDSRSGSSHHYFLEIDASSYY